MAPKDFIQARESGVEHAIVEDQPYLPRIILAPKGPKPEVAAAALAVLGLSPPSSMDCLKVESVEGGLSNTLYRVSGLQALVEAEVDAQPSNGKQRAHGNMITFDSILVRIFGAEGMIDRDVETSTFAVLAKQGHTPPYFGRFGNGRLEGWMEGMRPLKVPEMSKDFIIRSVATKMALLHTQFVVPENLQEYYQEPSMWRQLEEWLRQALQNTYKTDHDKERAATLNLETLQKDEFDWMRQNNIVPSDAMVVYCHNDVLAANIMLDDETEKLQLIDFEYGGCNYRSFDVANHWNEYASGPPHETVPHYDWLPNHSQQTLFCRTYLEAVAGGGTNNRDDQNNVQVTDEQVETLRREVQAFLLPNHLYWGLWAVNQAATEGCDKYDFMRYGMERFQQYHVCKKVLLSNR